MYNKSEATKQKILEATAEMMNKQPVENISISGIAKKANIAVGLVNYHFKTKENLLLAPQNILLRIPLLKKAGILTCLI